MHDHQYIEIKIKTLENKTDAWESIPIAITLWGNQEYLYDFFSSHFAKDNVWEVRWNWQGSPQGHYVAFKKFENI